MVVAYPGKTVSWEAQYNQDGNPANQITIKEEITISHYNQFLYCFNLIVLYFKINQSFEISNYQLYFHFQRTNWL